MVQGQLDMKLDTQWHNFGGETLPRKQNQVDLKIALISATCILPKQNDQMNSVYSFGRNSV